MAIVLAEIRTPVGPMLAGAVDTGVCLLEFGGRQAMPPGMAALKRHLHDDVVFDTHPHLDALGRELDAYFGGTLKQFSVPLVYPGSRFQVRVWNELIKIPYGQTRSYQQLAIALGVPGGSRAVGRANGTNRIAIVIPCHRVINASGGLGGYGGGLDRKRSLLALEQGGTLPSFQ
ncbi:MAG TPA: methylated-DNA--[protein]-cysteine S-methyltransferase [Gemmatimonadaceae bacterium]|nr:methylated-DNA--[protein]-cysteine S-methyltransferase [Gemmatimonadaceae bacterium]